MFTSASIEKLGLGVMAFVQISCTDHSEEATAKFERIIESAPQLLSCHNTPGEADSTAGDRAGGYLTGGCQ